MKTANLAVSIEEGQRRILNSVKPLDSETVTITEALNRVLYEDIISDTMIPRVDDSAMDGYAVIADDTQGASKNNPVRLHITGEIQAGDSAIGKQVSKGTAVRIMTGAPIPKGADSVIKFEDTEEEDGYLKTFHEAIKYENYRTAGENIKIGDCVLYKGNRLRSADIGILASLNCSIVKVFRQPTVSIISTGDELVDIGEKTRPGQIRNINAFTLYSEVKKYNGLPDYLGIARDTFEDTKKIFLKALKSDVIISTGGVSMGKYDFVKEIYSALNVEMHFQRVNVKPGSPCAFGTKDNKLIFGLPGNPVSTLTSFIQFVRPALLKLMGARRLKKPVVTAFLEEDINKHSPKVHLLRGAFKIRNNDYYVTTTGNQKPSILRSMSDANCLIIIPENSPKLKAGEKVTIQLIDHDEI